MLAALSLAVLGVLLLAGFARPIWALAILMTMFPLEQCLQGNSTFFIRQTTVTNLIVSAIAAVGLIRLAVINRLVVRHWFNPVTICTLLLYAYSALSVLWTLAPEWASEYIQNSLPYVILIVFAAPLLISRVGQIVELRNALMIIGTVVSILLLINPNFQFFNGRYVLALDAATYTNPLAIGSLGGMLVLAAVLAPPEVGAKRIPLLRATAFVAGLGLAFLSGSRGQVVFAILLVVILYPVSRRMKSLGSFVGFIAVVAVVAIGIFAVRSFFVSADNEARWSSESLVYGGEGRIDNLVDLATAYLDRPAYWAIGLGWLAFHDLPTKVGDPYSHVLVADLIFELGIPAATLGIVIGCLTIGSSVRLFRMVADDPSARANVSFLLAYLGYEFMLGNKAGHLWGQTSLFMICCLVCRLSNLERDVAVAASAQSDGSDDDHDVATLDDPTSVRLLTP